MVELSIADCHAHQAPCGLAHQLHVFLPLLCLQCHYWASLPLQDVTNLTVVDGSKRPYPSHHRRVSVKGYAAKAWALYMTAFSQVGTILCMQLLLRILRIQPMA